MIDPKPALTLSRRVADLAASPIREILAVIDRPGFVSFAGGLPAAHTFPEFELSTVPRDALQYGPSEGEPALRARIASNLAAAGIACTDQQVLVLSGSQQGIDLVGKLFIDAGTTVAVESPTYLAALQVFRFFGATLAPFVPGRSAPDWRGARRPAFAYAIPTFQNPTGRCYTQAERESLAQACRTHGVPLFEDDPYRDLVYDACTRTPVCALLTGGSWIYQGSFSKTLAPGLRLGFLAASQDLVGPLTRLKQAADLHSSRVSQALVLAQLEHEDRAQRAQRLVGDYRGRRDEFATALERHFGDLASWETPSGGLFFWLRLSRPIDTRTMLPQAIAQGVAFMPGEAFYPDPADGIGHLRLNFSHASAPDAERGLATLARLLASAPLP